MREGPLLPDHHRASTWGTRPSDVSVFDVPNVPERLIRRALLLVQRYGGVGTVAVTAVPAAAASEAPGTRRRFNERR
ncbi:hypothetical protein ACFZDI_10285 [Streptomyces sp. NPDC007907]|uniref:hypothetical protein n=1 Tax=Streptomyces sp. NPDC007907 TaxID=3364789 RepID=UPI0036E47014